MHSPDYGFNMAIELKSMSDVSGAISLHFDRVLTLRCLAGGARGDPARYFNIPYSTLLVTDAPKETAQVDNESSPGQDPYASDSDSEDELTGNEIDNEGFDSMRFRSDQEVTRGKVYELNKDSDDELR